MTPAIASLIRIFFVFSASAEGLTGFLKSQKGKE